MKAMIFAAGLGTRLKPMTNTIPKALIPIHGKPLLEHIILRLKNVGIKEIIVNVHHFPDLIIEFLRENNNFGIRIEISDEREQLLDTGGGMKKASWFFDDGKPFLIHNVDILSNLNISEFINENYHDDERIASLVVSRRNTNRYLLFNNKKELNAWVNVKTNEIKPSDDLEISHLDKYAFAGIQLVSPKVFQLMKGLPDKFPIIDFYLDNCLSSKVVGYIPADFKMIDVGKLDSLERAEEFVSENNAINPPSIF